MVNKLSYYALVYYAAQQSHHTTYLDNGNIQQYLCTHSHILYQDRSYRSQPHISTYQLKAFLDDIVFYIKRVLALVQHLHQEVLLTKQNALRITTNMFIDYKLHIFKPNFIGLYMYLLVISSNEITCMYTERHCEIVYIIYMKRYIICSTLRKLYNQCLL